MGARAEVQTSFVPTCTADVIAVDTDSRLMPPADAAHVVEAMTHAAIGAGAEWLYKKTDSVLRGNVRAEIEAMMKASGLFLARLFPRIRRGAHYSRWHVFH